jgi:D-beta-D-heptose 7-phosphate kinase/D-beta-D-heptose 1-phosphate adenosyltransferase
MIPIAGVLDYKDPLLNGTGALPVAAVSGGFDPLHVGHLDLFENALSYGPLVVICNGDWFLRQKKHAPLMSLADRARIVSSLRCVTAVVTLEIENDMSVCEALKRIRPKYFCNGGDRKEDNIPEVALCKEMGIEMVFNVGGHKRTSSSAILKRWVGGELTAAG